MNNSKAAQINIPPFQVLNTSMAMTKVMKMADFYSFARARAYVNWFSVPGNYLIVDNKNEVLYRIVKESK